jgi:hypothetical protein
MNINNTYFKSEKHYTLFKIFQLKSEIYHQGDTLSTLYLLSAIEDDNIINYISVDYVDFYRLVEECKTWDANKNVLVLLSATLYHNELYITFEDMLDKLTSDNHLVVIEALTLKYGRSVKENFKKLVSEISQILK